MKLMLIINLLILSLLSTAQEDALLYENTFEDNDLSNFHFTDSKAWTHKDGTLALIGQSDYKPPFRSPFNIAILKTPSVSDFTLEVDLKQTGKEYGHRDMCIFFGINDPTNFYYVHLASQTDDHAHNIFIVNDEARKKISLETTNGIDWGEGWNKVKIERNTADGEILIYYNDMETPIMKASDLHFPSGHIGFGSFDDTGMVDNIKLSGTKAEVQKGFF
jgi:hypothetical protein